MITYVEYICYLVQYIGVTVIYIVSGPLCTNEYLLSCLYERAHFPNYNVAMPSGGSRRTRQYVQNPEELDAMPTISGGEADGGVGIETSSEGFWTYCLVRLEPPDGIGIVIRKNVHFLHQYSNI